MACTLTLRDKGPGFDFEAMTKVFQLNQFVIQYYIHFKLNLKRVLEPGALTTNSKVA